MSPKDVNDRMYFLKQMRKDHHLKQSDVAKLLGISRQAYSKYETGLADPSTETLRKLAEHYGTSIDYLIRGISDRPECLPVPETKTVPRIGTVSCGAPILAVENYDTYDEVPTSVHCDFTVLARGDSMLGARINDGDIVYIRQQDECESGDIVAVLLNDEVILKRYIIANGTRMLMSENPKYLPIILHKEDAVRILGKAVGFVAKL